MRNNDFDLLRILCEATVDRGLREIQRESKRSLRNFVDLAMNFSKGKLSRHFLGLFQSMLKDENSAYFEAAQALTQEVDLDTLKTFCVNFSLEGCSRGARKIRELEDSQGFNIPWAAVLCAGSEGLDLSDCLRFVGEGTELGINVYFLLDYSFSGESLQRLSSAYPKCAFFFLDNGLCADSRELFHLQDLRNVMYLIDIDKPGWQETADSLRRGKFLYGVYRWYGDENADRVSNEAALEQYQDDGTFVIFLLAEKNCSQEKQDMVRSRAMQQRMAQEYPFCLLDLGGDMRSIDSVLSDGACSLAIGPDGQAVMAQAGTLEGPDYNVHSSSLQEILQRAARKKG